MHDQFKKSNPEVKCSYYTYRHHVSEMNISFTKLGHEECGRCEQYKLHNDSHVELNKSLTDGRSAERSTVDCRECDDWKKHIARAKAARAAYKNHAESEDWSLEKICYSAGLQKGIMLPRMECFKEVIFARRIIAFNESFVPVGSKKQHSM